MLFFSRQLKNIMNFTEKFTRVAQQNMGFMGKNYLISDIEKAIVTYKKLNSGEEVNEQELDFYNELNKDMYTQYQLYLQTQ